mmetsp:Transcript_60836/g.91852  ORF Transcript_60836/g.91852 Transcript_60836/m.91852 type:complete len:272 (+) Transcript_60836:500-1315(+)
MRIMSSVMCFAPATCAPSPIPGKMYALLPCPGTCVFPSTTTGSNGLPLANRHLPLLHVNACSAVHSAFDVGFDSGMMIGRSFSSHIKSTTSLLNTPGCALTPTIPVGFSDLIASMKSLTSACSCAYAILWCCKPAKRDFTTSPFESTSQHRFRASSKLKPSATSSSTIRSAIPVPASPAPWNRNSSSLKSDPFARFALSSPASATDAVPWMSSLNVQIFPRNFSSSPNAVVFPKSSNWIRTPGHFSCMAMSTSSTNASYSSPLTRGCFSPV